MGQELIEIPQEADVNPEVRELVDTFKTLPAITTPETYQVAADMLDKARRMWKDAEAERKDATSDLKETIRIISEPFDFVVKIGKLIDDECKKQMQAYDRKVEQERGDQQAEMNRKIAEENRQRIANAEQVGIIPVLAAPAIVAAVPKTILTAGGASTQTKAKGRKDFTINGLTSEEIEGMSASDPRLLKIPREFLEPSMKRLKAAAQNDIPVCDDFQTFETFDYRLPSKKKG